MDLYEYQGKQLFAAHGIPVPEGRVAETPEEARAAAEAIGGRVVVKAQVQIGGRGKAGGIKLARSPHDAKGIASDMLGMRLVTKQTGEKGKLVRKLYVEAASKIDRELYLAMLVDRATQSVAIIASTEGGMDIEEVAARTPEKILNVQIDPLVGICGFQARNLAHAAAGEEESCVSTSSTLAGLGKGT